MDRGETVVEVTITLKHLAYLAAALAVAAVALTSYPRIRMTLIKELAKTRLAEIELGKRVYEPGETVEVKVCPAPEAGIERVSLIVTDPDGYIVYSAILELSRNCASASFRLRPEAVPGAYRVIAEVEGELLASTTFEVSETP